MTKLSDIKVLYREPDSMTLWGIPYEMRPGQSPRDLADHPKRNWTYLGNPGWWGSLSKERQAEIKEFLAGVDTPDWPGEWCRL